MRWARATALSVRVVTKAVRGALRMVKKYPTILSSRTVLMGTYPMLRSLSRARHSGEVDQASLRGLDDMARALIEELNRPQSAQHVIERGMAQVAVINDGTHADVWDGGLERTKLHSNIEVGYKQRE